MVAPMLKKWIQNNPSLHIFMYLKCAPPPCQRFVLTNLSLTFLCINLLLFGITISRICVLKAFSIDRYVHTSKLLMHYGADRSHCVGSASRNCVRF